MSSSACTAVGGSNAGALAERWNGTRWRIQRTPNPTGPPGVFLDGVSCPTESFCMAIGASGQSTPNPKPPAERWNGTSWRIVRTPNPSGAQFAFLNGVDCTSPAACTAAGIYQNSSGDFVSLAERWKGTRWRIQPTPTPAIPPFAFHLTGLNAVSCIAGSACTAVGGSMSNLSTPVTLAEHWNGTAIQSAPNRAGAAASGLFSVACTSARSCMAVGGTSSPNDIGGFLAEHWDGTRWRNLPAPTLPLGQFPASRAPRPHRAPLLGSPTRLPPKPGPWPSGGTAPGGAFSPPPTL